MNMARRLTIALATVIGLSAGASAAEFSYSYLELTTDLSKTKNTAPHPLEDDADGRLFGIAGSWNVFDSFYVKGAWSWETKEFGNEVAGTALTHDLRHTVTTLGVGYHLEPIEQTSVYLEALVIPDFEVKHSIPRVVPSSFGPPSVTKIESIIDGDGFGGALGVRHWLNDGLELEGAVTRIYTTGKVRRTGGEISDFETILRLGGHFHAGAGLSVGMFASFAKHTDPNFNNIRKLGLTLRYHF